MLGARLDELRLQKDAPFLSGYSGWDNYVRSLDMVYGYASVKESGVERGLDALLQEGRRVALHGFTTSELERAKTDLLRHFEQSVRQRNTAMVVHLPTRSSATF